MCYESPVFEYFACNMPITGNVEPYHAFLFFGKSNHVRPEYESIETFLDSKLVSLSRFVDDLVR